MSVLYLAYLVVGVLSQASWSDGNTDTGLYPGSGSLEEIIPYILLLIVFILGMVQSTYIYHEIVLMNMRLSID